MEKITQFNNCEICGAEDWDLAYKGPIRDGAFGHLIQDAQVGRCIGCGAERLAEGFCLSDTAYTTPEYRRKLNQGLKTEDYLKVHNPLQVHTLEVSEPLITQDTIVADIGCAGGSLLDHIQNITAEQVAIEPCEIYHERLSGKGYNVFPNLIQSYRDWSGRVELAFSIHVVEHVSNPKSFLEEIRVLMAPGGRLVLATPNRRDLLLDLLPDVYREFFYRVVHRWYFDADSLGNCARRAGWKLESVQYVQRYGMANMLHWLRDKIPAGNKGLPDINEEADAWWKKHMEQNGRAECLYLVLKNPS